MIQIDILRVFNYTLINQALRSLILYNFITDIFLLQYSQFGYKACLMKQDQLFKYPQKRLKPFAVDNQPKVASQQVEATLVTSQ